MKYNLAMYIFIWSHNIRATNKENNSIVNLAYISYYHARQQNFLVNSKEMCEVAW